MQSYRRGLIKWPLPPLLPLFRGASAVGYCKRVSSPQKPTSWVRKGSHYTFLEKKWQLYFFEAFAWLPHSLFCPLSFPILNCAWRISPKLNHTREYACFCMVFVCMNVKKNSNQVPFLTYIYENLSVLFRVHRLDVSRLSNGGKALGDGFLLHPNLGCKSPCHGVRCEVIFSFTFY